MGYKYEMHTHDRIGSKCGSFTPEQLVDTFLSQGYTGIFSTNHFFCGNTAAPGPEKEWKYRLEKFCDAYRAVKAEGDKRGLDVFFGFEYTVPHSLDPIASNAGCDFLVFGVDDKWLENYGGDVESCPTRQYLNRIREAGGTVIQAHPYRLEERYMDHICLMPDCVDGVEVINTSPNTMESNTLARVYADYYGFFHTAGSDIHGTDRKLLGVTELPEKAADERDFMRMLKERKQKLYIQANQMWRELK